MQKLQPTVMEGYKQLTSGEIEKESERESEKKMEIGSSRQGNDVLYCRRTRTLMLEDLSRPFLFNEIFKKK